MDNAVTDQHTGGPASIEGAVALWHRFATTRVRDHLDDLFADDVEFYSPILRSPLRGKGVMVTYAVAAASVFGHDSGGRFRFTKQAVVGDVAMLEFETTIGDVDVNGVDILRCDDAGKVVEFRVMVRPLRAVNAVHERMRAALEGSDA